jgi:GNAT superfamily N-acetyltransferase
LLKPGAQGLVVNVYTEREWRRRGLGEMVMRAIIDWSKEHGVASLALHASDMGRPLYERLGFEPTNEMSYAISRHDKDLSQMDGQP